MSILIFCIGLLAQACFSARILIQWFLSEKKHEVISPTRMQQETSLNYTIHNHPAFGG